MTSANPFRLQLEHDDVSGWLLQFDSAPRLIPRWPESSRMTLVAVIVDGFDTLEEKESEAVIITTPTQAQTLVESINATRAVLFFCIPKRRAMQVCEAIREEDWYTVPTE